MPKKQRNSKNRSAGKRRSAVTSAFRKHAFYSQPCPLDLLVQEFGEDGAQWLTDEYERPLNMADLKLEQCIRVGEFTMDHPDNGATKYSLREVSETLEMTIQLILDRGRREGLLTEAQLRETDHGMDVDHEVDGPDIIRQHHWVGGLVLNHRNMWDFFREES
ncbi:hypothetical protein ACFRCX_30815 [Streptomyces sp. NPDC056652]|uniref:hypothetical protein n=1 Tax=Streptomyces sp. NPDC056652 TaxID=3345893 RepID=UPI0036A8F699